MPKLELEMYFTLYNKYKRYTKLGKIDNKNRY
jgi:hypothetical protein